MINCGTVAGLTPLIHPIGCKSGYGVAGETIRRGDLFPDDEATDKMKEQDGDTI
ncbi:hypothetical protein SAMN05216308_11136 [Nitrosospira sp. Nsp13]|nr:hypothetical protein SAMN05216308_11136 [Nitrosospira sp. Nsp13]